MTLLLRSVDVLRGGVSAAAAGAEASSEAALAFRRRLSDAAEAAELAPCAGEVAAAQPPASGAGDAREARTDHASGTRTLRVDVAKLDRMLDLSGEIAISRGRLADLLESAAARARSSSSRPIARRTGSTWTSRSSS